VIKEEKRENKKEKKVCERKITPLASKLRSLVINHHPAVLLFRNKINVSVFLSFAVDAENVFLCFVSVVLLIKA